METPVHHEFLILHDFPSPDIEALWREFLGRTECPAHYDTPEFFLEPYWEGKNPFAVLAFADSNIVGVITGHHNEGEVVAGLPFRPQICLDPGADEILTTDTLVLGLLREAGRANLISVYGWAPALAGFEQRGFHNRQIKGNVVVDLRVGAQALFDGFALRRRRDIRSAIRNGIEVSEATTTEDLQEYWSVYSAWRKTERKQVRHNVSFDTVQKLYQMRGNRRRFLARYEGKVIAASGIRFCPGGLVEYSDNCSLDEFVKLRPNDLLLWRLLEWGCQQGCQRFSLGGSDPFHCKWGETIVPVYRYRLDRTFLRRYDRKESLAGMGRTLFRRMPVSLQRTVRRLAGM